MDQIKKRLEIIKIAIFMSDDETIRLQLLKLEYFEENEQLDKIIDLLKRKNYGQAQVLISEYLNNPRTPNKQDVRENEDTSKQANISNNDSKSIVDDFGMLKSSSLSNKHGLQSTNQNIKQDKTKDTITSYVGGSKNFELSLDEIEKIPSRKQTTDTPQKEKVDFSDIFTTSKKEKIVTEEKQKKITPEEEIVTEEKNSDLEDSDQVIENHSEETILEEKNSDLEDNNQIIENRSEETVEQKEINLEPKEYETENKEENNEPNEENLDDDLEMLITTDSETSNTNIDMTLEENLESRESANPYDKKYPPVSDIFHKFQNIALFHIGNKNYTLHKSSANWMHRISKVGYKEIEILKIAKYIQKLKEQKEHNEAIQLALICCATESNLGKLIFARELYKGDIVEQDHFKACEMTKELALLDYPEALCDLGQYCEHGIGTKKSLEYALHFYKKAYDLGLDRANILYKNLKRKKGLFSFLFKSEI